ACGARSGLKLLSLLLHLLMGDVGMACGARSGLKPPNPLQWHLLEQRRRQAHPEAPTKQTATSDELVAPQPPAPTPQWSAPGWEPGADGSRGCGYADGRARRLWERATHDGPRSCPPFPQNETRTALPPRQTTRGSLAQTGVSRAWDRSPHSAPHRHTRHEG